MKTNLCSCWRCGAQYEETIDDFASFSSECPDCVERIKERDRELLATRARKNEPQGDKRILKITPKIFLKTDVARLPKAQYEKIIPWKIQPKGLLLTGPSGRGKTRCLWQLAHRLIREGRDVEFLRETEFSHQVAKRGHRGTLWDWVEHLCKVEVLIFDDLGKAPRTDRFVSELFHIVDTRLNDELPMLISTQLEGNGIKDQIRAGMHEAGHTAEALVRRLRESCDIVNFNEDPKPEV